MDKPPRQRNVRLREELTSSGADRSVLAFCGSPGDAHSGAGKRGSGPGRLLEERGPRQGSEELPTFNLMQSRRRPQGSGSVAREVKV